MSNEATISPEQVVALVSAKAAAEPAFATALLANPRAELEKLFGMEFPGHITFQAVAQPADTYVIPVPQGAQVGPGGELTDDDLEAVAGGSKAGANKVFNHIGNNIANDMNKIGSSVVSTVGQMVTKSKC